MEREYLNIEKNKEVTFFIGKEVEKTPAYDKTTLFVVGLQPITEIEKHLENIDHIFFGANHSFDPTSNEEWTAWEELIQYFLDSGKFCSLDINIKHAEDFNEGGLCEYNKFIPQIRIPIPYIQLWNYNTMIKIDDKSYNATNPGVWCHRLHKLKDPEAFTDWEKYTLDKIIE